MKRSIFVFTNSTLGCRLSALVSSASVSVWLAALLALLSARPAPAAGRQALPRHVPAAAANLQPIGPLAGTNSLDLAIVLPLRNQAALTSLLRELYDPASPNSHQYLTAEQFAERFGPTEQDYRALIAFAEANGLTIVERHPNRTLLHVKGAVADIERTFQVTMHVYRHPTERRTFYAPDAAPTIDIGIPILDIRGLENYELPHPALKVTPLDKLAKVTAMGSGLGGTFLGKDFRNAYAPGVTLNGSGQAVALFEMDGYFTNDITAYESQAGLPNVTLTNVLLGGFDGVPVDPNAVVEVSLDIEMAIAMAPGLSQVMVYEAPVTSAGAYDILNRMATDNQAKQISSSWVIDRLVTNPVPSQIYQQFAAQGQSFFQASGDEGAYSPGTYQTADNPFITTVGGTTLTTAPGGAWVSETAWFGSGGGISSVFTIPSYQQGINMTANMGSTTMRNVPDVALTAENVEVITDDGEMGSVSGTSCAAPLWAGFTALINQQAAANGRLPIGFINPALYALGQQAGYTLGMHDITTGSNPSDYGPNVFYAVPGYDLCTGWGTPNGSNLINALVAPADALEISPGLGFAASGPPGGPFTPAAQSYSLKNAGATPLNWTLVNTSAWLTVTATSGQLAAGGLPVVVTASLNAAASNLLAGTYATAIRFTNLNDGVVQGRQFILQVATAPAMPAVITAQPTNQFVLAGGTATFSVGATGTGLHYYWQKNGASLTDGGHLSGSATSILTVSNAAVADAAVYSVIVSNAAGPVSSVGAALVVYSPGGGQLVQNGGFEAGNFSAWTLSGNTNLMAVTTNAFAVHSGAHGAEFGPAGSLGFLSQTVPTVPGSAYLISAWLDSLDGKAPNEFIVQWNGNTLFDQANLGAIGWTNLQFIVTATGASTVLAFGFQDDPSYLALDDVSVLAMTNTASPPIFTSQPLIQEVTAGGTATFSALATGTSPLTYHWRLNGASLSNGGNYSGVTTPQLTVSNTAPANAGTYSVVVSNTYGFAASLGAVLVVLPSGAQVLTFDDLPETVNGLAVANGYGALNWNNFGEIDGLGLANYVGPSGYTAGVVSPNNVVFNGDGLPASISSAGAPFNLDSAYLTAAWNDNLQVQAFGFVGSNNLAFSNTWTLSATAPTLVQFNYTNVTEVDFVSSGGAPHPGYSGSGEHFVMDNLAVSFVGSVLIIQQPASQAVGRGEAATFSVTAIGSLPLSYQWQKNGVNLSDGGSLSGAATSTLTVSNAASANAGVYSVIVSNSYGALTSAGAALAVYSLGPTSLVQNGGFETGDFTGWQLVAYDDLTIVTNNPVVVHSGAYGAQLSYGYLYQYLPTVAGASYRLSLWLNSLPPAGENYFEVYWGGAGYVFDESDLAANGWNNLQFVLPATSSSTELYLLFYNEGAYFALDDVSVNVLTNVAGPPVITDQPIARTMPLGGTAAFSVVAGGTTPLSYQWRWNGTNLTDGGGISGSITPSLAIGNVAAANLGTYSVFVTNAFGAAASVGAPLSLLPAGTTVITFDDLPEALYGLAITNGYQRLNWTNFSEIDGVNTPFYQPAATAAVVSSNNVAFGENDNGSVPAISSSSGSFNLYSAYLTAADQSPYPLAVLGYAGSALLYSNYYTLNDTAPALIDFNYTNVTEVAFVPASYNSVFFMDNVALSFNGPVTIVSQPANQGVFTGQTATFGVTAIGSLPLSYQWQKNGVSLSDGGSLSGAATSTLTVSNAAPANAGVYSVIVSNSYGPVTSAGAALAVSSLGPANLVQNGGFETGDFTGWTQSGDTKSTYVSANAFYVHSGNYGAQLGPYGSYGELYQTVPTTAGSTYQLSLFLDSQPQQGYNYFEVIWNDSSTFYQSDLGLFGWTNLQFLVTASAASTSLEFHFENDDGYFGLDDVSVMPITNVASPPVITGQPLPQLLSPGGTATFSVTAAGTAPLGYQWQMNGTNLTNGVNLSGSTSNSLTISNVSPASVGTYSVVVTNAYGTGASAGAALALLPAGEQMITFDDLPDTYSGLTIPNGYAGLNWGDFEEVDGANAYNYQPGSSAGMVSPGNVAIGYDTAIISSANGTFGFRSAYLTAASYNGYPLQVLGYAGSVLLYSNSYYLSSTAPTLFTFNYTNVSQVQFSMDDYYDFVMDNVVISTNAVSAPAIASEPAGQSVPFGATATFSVSAIGSAPLGYQWLFNGASLTNGGSVSGATTTQLTVSNAAAANIGAYSAVATNAYGSATSAVAMLSVYVFGANNLVQNGGFETGDFTSWTLSGDPKNIYVSTNAFYVHSGRFGAQLGPYGYTYLSQTIPTSPGASYQLSFWLDPDGQGDNWTYWNGSELAYPVSMSAAGWTNLQFVVAATGSSTTLEFEFYDPSSYMGLDDVSVTSFIVLNTVPVQILSPQVMNGSFTFGFQTIAGQSYTIQESTNLGAANWNTYTNFTGTGSPCQFSAPLSSTQHQGFFRVSEP
ncbi:MAG: immunoglobulin domain-containing protein [Verrucomicrobiota bacterium]